MQGRTSKTHDLQKEEIKPTKIRDFHISRSLRGPPY
jgi:hypothetical protein